MFALKYGIEKIMKKNTLNTVIKSIFFPILTWSAIASAEPPEWAGSGKAVEVVGELEVFYIDDFEHNRGKQHYIIHDKHQGKHFELEFQGKPPKGAKTGSFVRVRGQVDNQQILMEANGTSSFEVLASDVVMVSGEQKTIVLVADFTDTAVSCSTLDIEDSLFSDPNQQSVNHLYRETSLDQVQFSGTVAGPFTINYSSTDTCNVSAWAQAAEDQAVASGINLGDYNRKVYVLPKQNGCGSAGLSTVGGNPSRSWVFRCDMPDVFAHELGHSLGMGHAGNATGEYNDTSDIMGFSGSGMRQINGPHQEQMGWREPQQITEISADGIYDVAPLELDSVSAIAPQLLKIRKPDTGEWYYLSFRQAIGFDATLSNTYLSGLSIHRHAGNGASSKTVWIDTLADSENYSDSVNGLSITQLGSSENSVSVEISFSNTCTRNTPTVNITPASQTDLAGSTLHYDLSITNNDTASCADSNWAIATNTPAGWSEAVTSNEITLVSGSSATVNWQVTSADSSVDGNYALSVNLIDSASITHDSSVAANYTVTTPSDTEQPTTPSALTASVQRKKILVSWQSSTDNIAVAGYHVFRNDVLIATTASTSYSDSNLTNGTTYTYYGVAFDAANNDSFSSNTSSVTFGKAGSGSKGGGKKR